MVDEKILIVDDDMELCALLEEYLTGEGFHLETCHDGNLGYEKATSHTYALVILDVMLPGVDGWELLTDLHEYPDTRSIPVIVCSVVTGAELASALGAALYLPKPVRRRQFIQALDQVLSQVPAKAEKTEANNATRY